MLYMLEEKEVPIKEGSILRWNIPSNGKDSSKDIGIVIKIYKNCYDVYWFNTRPWDQPVSSYRWDGISDFKNYMEVICK